MAKTVADQFAETLAAAGVKRIYGIVGVERADRCDFPSRVGGFRERLVEIGQRTYAHLENSR
jgi:thiamine pyrophosphate-dependent acetolactate synthase large subunit-like protein